MEDIHPQLLNDCLVLGHFPLSHLLLMQDANYPWFILVPDRAGITEVYQLSIDDQQQLLEESSSLAKLLMDVFEGDKLNIASLGNMVSQCHIHHVVRYKNDIAWPGPIWGRVPAKAYSQAELDSVINKIKQVDLKDFIFSPIT